MFPPIITDYLSGADFLKSFYAYEPSLESFAGAIQNRAFDESKRELLATVLSDQYTRAGMETAAITKLQIQKLASPGTFTVTTGHQLSVFTGPLYFIYKIITTIKLAEELSVKYPSNHFVPVFWLASEDHDFAEINHIHLFGRTLTWDTPTDHQPVGKIRTETLKLFISEIKKLFANSERLPYLLSVFEEAYLKSENLSVATRKIVHALFERYGLLIIDPDDLRLKRSLKEVMLADILEQTSYRSLRQTNSRLETVYKLQVNGREINFFYLSEEGRNLVKKEGAKFVVANTDKVFSADEMKAEIQDHPERFSPNVVLRPVYQELILPNLAYVGGPGELSYWLQLKSVFEAYDTFFPVLWQRNSAVLLNKGLAQKIMKSGLEAADYFLPVEQLEKKFTEGISGIDITEISGRIDTELQRIIDAVQQLDNKMVAGVIRYKHENAAYLSRLKKEIREKVKEKSEENFNKVLKIKEILFPGGVAQERYQNVLQFNIPGNDIDLIGEIYKNLPLNPAYLSILLI
jgi:bacillithiol biosynthesis cysteine-adding enzyme BshC